MKLKNVVVNGVAYLGQVVRNEEGVVVAVEKALNVKNYGASAIKEYVKAKNRNKLVAFTLEGSADTIQVAELSPDARLKYKVTKMKMKAIKASVVRDLENEALDAGKFALR